ncbi:hypothetical protein LPJ61_000860 [Coemansia biformis]|uniref:RING-type E3 ubiquitin transferase n=1 Tax=Coemansia biformis TaxID=1286918 RepID=A0A9W8D054_9FUNG|nr:hypothetical protein LPJ61_000860 [Coemansia biformis]
MKIRVRPSSGEQVFAYVNVDRTEMVEATRIEIAAALEKACGRPFPPERLSLIFRGKQLADGMRLFDYGVNHGDTFLSHLKASTDSRDESGSGDDCEGIADDVGSGPSTSVSVSVSVDGSPTPVPSVVETPGATTGSDVADKGTKSGAGGEADTAAGEGEVEVTCDHCDNSQKSLCNHCGCYYCGMKDDEHHTLACDECGRFYHLRCLPTPLAEVPEGDWYCEFCKNDPNLVVAGEQKLDLSTTRKARMPAAKQTKAWGGGMACVGTTKTCTIVPKDHVGGIPGVHVGQSWRYRIHVSESGIHRPPVAGISGSSTKPAVSIVLAGGYPEDIDHGEEFVYTGSGGYDLSGNKRQAKVQSFDQELTRQNRSLALACAAPVNDTVGATAKDWQASSPIRVCRSYKAAKMHPEYAPAEGVRYDGLYRIAKYWKEKGVSGFYVWRYLFRRDDPDPAPWTEEGRARIARLGLTMYDPDGAGGGIVPTTKDTGAKAGAKAGAKRKAGDAASPTAKQTRRFQPTAELWELMRLDKENARLWANMDGAAYASESAYLEGLCEGHLGCPICQELVQQPITTPCGHNICNPCLCKSMSMFGLYCPVCRADISTMGRIADVRQRVNQNLATVLMALIPSYGKEWATAPLITAPQQAWRQGEPVGE